MDYPIKTSEINQSLDFFNEVMPLIQESKSYLSAHKWCGNIFESWLFTNVGYSLCIFLYQIDNLQSPEDDLIWVIAGDIPCMYLSTRDIDSTTEAIETYTNLAEDRINAAESDKSLEDCFPFDIEKTGELIEMFKVRVRILKNNILPNIDKISYRAAAG